MRTRLRLRLPLVVLAGLALVTGVSVGASSNEPEGQSTGGATPIQHLVVLYQENNSFDHYFATYPVATNQSGEPKFYASPDTPSVNGLNDVLLAPNNPNSAQPFRLDRSQAVTCDQDHVYTDEQTAYDKGLMDMFVEKLGVGTTIKRPCPDYGHGKSLVMGYYDGNTVTALWNYAQNFAMSDNTYETGFGPSTPGNINLISAQTHGFTGPDITPFGTAVTVNDTIIGDPQPLGDICSSRDTSTQLPASTDKNIGDLLNAKGITWGNFAGGFREAPGVATCTIAHANVAGAMVKDYIPHHEAFQYYRSTQNLQHLAPTSVAKIGQQDQANHQYDLSDFWAAIAARNMPAVSFLKAEAYQDGHPGYSDPLDEQHFVVDTLNRLQRTPYWNSTAVMIMWDDSDGWYDHQMGPIVNQSNDPAYDTLAGNNCGTNPNDIAGGYQDRCSYGPRVPLLVVSPFAKHNYVDHATTDQSSVLRFIEDNWLNGARIGDGSLDAKAGSLKDMFVFGESRGDEGGANKLFLNPQTGERTGEQD